MPVYRVPLDDGAGAVQPQRRDEIPDDVAFVPHYDTRNVVEIHASGSIPVYENDDDAERIAKGDARYCEGTDPEPASEPEPEPEAEPEPESDEHVCDVCGKTFESPNALHGHRSSHSE